MEDHVTNVAKTSVSARVEDRPPQSEEWLRLAAEGSQLGLWYWDEVRQELFWDVKTRAMFDAPATGPVTLDHFSRALHPEDRHIVFKTWRESLESGSPFIYEYRVLKPDGGIRWIQSRGKGYCDDARKHVRMVGVVFDITGQKLIEDRLRTSERRLMENEKFLRRLSGQLISAQEDERKRIARELHDDLNQQVADVCISLRNIQVNVPDSLEHIRSELLSLKNRLFTLSDELRHISHELHPGILEIMGLAATLRSHCAEVAAAIAVPVEFEANCDGPAPSNVALCFYRVAQESIRNAAKHSHASKVKVSLTQSDNLLNLTISDDGIGFNVEEALTRGGLGLRSMEERVRLIDANLELFSQAGYGTTLMVTADLLGDAARRAGHC